MHSDGSMNGTDVSATPRSWEQVLIIISGTLLAIFTAGGNLLVIISFKIDRRLQTISNYFLLSLAVADFTIGIISCPFMTLYTAQGEWSLGYSTCQFWLSTDYLMSNASVWNLLLISLDRFLSVTKPLTYRPMRTSKKAIVTIVSTFVFSMILWPPWIIAWPHIDGYFEVASNACAVQFLVTNIPVTIATIVVAFYLPVSIMIGLYARVYYETKKRQKDMKKLLGFHSSKRKQRQSEIRRLSKKRVLHLPSSDPQSGESKRTLPFSRQSTRQTIEITTFGQTSSRMKITRLMSYLRKPSKSHQASYIPSESSSHTVSDEHQSFRDSHSASIDGPHSTSIHVPYKHRSATRSRGERNCPSVATTTPNQQAPLLRSDTDVVLTNEAPQTHASRSLDDAADMSYRVVINLGNEELRQGSVQILTDLTSADAGHGGTSQPTTKDICSAGKNNITSFINETSIIPAGSLQVVSPIGRTITPNDIAKGLQPYSRRHACSPMDNGNNVTICNAAVLVHDRNGRLRNQNVKTTFSPTTRNQVHRERRSQDSKAAKTLSAILLVFIVTWAPYSIIVVIEAFKPGTIPVQFYTFSYYLCYMNSTINPLCYALCNTNFRQTYIRILTLSIS